MAIKNGVCAVIVAYRPDIDTLCSSVELCKEQVEQIYIFSNGDGVDSLSYLRDIKNGVFVQASSCNIGLAAGLNRGIAFAKQSGFSYVLLLDQDSLPSLGMVSALLDAYVDLSKVHRVAAVGASAIDVRNGLGMPFVKIGFPVNKKQYALHGVHVPCDFLITSGSLIHLSVFNGVGDMDDGLFIDNVDLDWCFRASAKGFEFFGVGDAKMGHAIGDALISSRMQKGGFFVHKPIRLYYIMRNRVLLYRRKTTPMRWILQDLLRLPFKFFSMVLFHPPRFQYLRCMLAGLRDGILGRDGPAPN